MISIAPNSFWQYRGPENGRGETHKVIFVDAHEIVTVAGTRSWLGPADLFLKHFTPVTPATPAK